MLGLNVFGAIYSSYHEKEGREGERGEGGRAGDREEGRKEISIPVSIYV